MKNKQTNMEALNSTGFTKYINEEVVNNAPINKEKGKLELFNVGKYISCDDLEKEYKSRNLIPVDLITLSSYVKKNPNFKEKYICTQWKDKKGEWCYAAFNRSGDGRYVGVGRRGSDWNDRWWFAGVRKYSSKSSGTKNLNLDTLSLEKRIANLEAFEEKVRKFLIL